MVAAAARGDRDAFGLLYRRFSRAVHGVLVARLTREDAEDLVQDVFMHAFTRLKRFATAGGVWQLDLRDRPEAGHRSLPPKQANGAFGGHCRGVRPA